MLNKSLFLCLMTLVSLMSLSSPVVGTCANTLQLFVTKSKLNGDFLGSSASAADALCASEASSASLSTKGTWKAVLSTSAETSIAGELFAKGSWSIVNTQGNVLSHNLKDILSGASDMSGGLLDTVLYNDGTAPSTDELVWTGATSQGEWGGNEKSCFGFSSTNSLQTASVGNPLPSSSPSNWLHSSEAGCDGSYSVYCVEVPNPVPKSKNGFLITSGNAVAECLTSISSFETPELPSAQPDCLSLSNIEAGRFIDSAQVCCARPGMITLNDSGNKVCRAGCINAKSDDSIYFYKSNTVNSPCWMNCALSH